VEDKAGMTIRYPEILSAVTGPLPFEWSDKETLLYAIAIGFGDDERDLPYVYEQPGLKIVPTITTVLANNTLPDFDEIGINELMMVHGEQIITLHQPIPVAGKGTSTTRVLEVLDKGDRGAVGIFETELTLADGSLLATLESALFARADGHFGGPARRPVPPPPTPPDRAPDHHWEYAIKPNQALLYRLLGDRTAFHADPAMARAAGFERPILHGLCTYGIACRAVIEAFDLEPTQIRSHAVRFTAPILPGDTIAFDLWREGDTILFEARNAGSDVLVLRNGVTRLR
jgi:acyl dehydratase